MACSINHQSNATTVVEHKRGPFCNCTTTHSRSYLYLGTAVKSETSTKKIVGVVGPCVVVREPGELAIRGTDGHDRALVLLSNYTFPRSAQRKFRFPCIATVRRCDDCDVGCKELSFCIAHFKGHECLPDLLFCPLGPVLLLR